MILFPCPECGVQLKVKDELSGRMGKCPGCAKAIQVPFGSTAGRQDGSTEQPFGNRPPSAASIGRPGSRSDFAFLEPAQGAEEIGRLGPYRILGVLGTGSMGIVFKAEDTKLKRPVALKVMRPNFASKQEYRLRFVREAQATAQLDHPHVVPIYHVEDNGVPYLAMKLLAGHSLEERLRQVGGWLPPREVYRIGEEVADALSAAHDRGLIHRDVKPTNIWLELEGDRIKLIDFGLARVLDDDMRLTGTGFVVGTPSYMAPEQANGEEVDHRSDLFSLGCVLYRASTGQLPFPGQYAVDVVAAVRMTEPKPPRSLDPNLPPVFSDLIMQLLCKKPEGRPQSARVVRDTLRALRSGNVDTALKSSEAVERPPSKLHLPNSLRSGPSGWLPTLGFAVALAAALIFLYFSLRSFIWPYDR